MIFASFVGLLVESPSEMYLKDNKKKTLNTYFVTKSLLDFIFLAESFL